MRDVPWRTELRAFLLAHAGEPLPVGALYELFSGAIPFHHITRMWLSDGNNKRQLSCDASMRWRAFTHAISRYPLAFDPLLDKSHHITYAHTVTAKASSCPMCGNPFLPMKHTGKWSQTCGWNCGTKLRKMRRGTDERTREGVPAPAAARPPG